MNMKSRKKPIQTGLEIDVKPISDKGMTEEEFRARIAEFQKDRERQEILNRVAEAEVAKRKPRGPIQKTQPSRPVSRPHPQYGFMPNRGLLVPDPQPRSSPFMGLLAVSGSKP